MRRDHRAALAHHSDRARHRQHGPEDGGKVVGGVGDALGVRTEESHAAASRATSTISARGPAGLTP